MMLDSKPVALFNVVNDSDEKANVLFANPDIARAFEQEWNAWLEANSGQPPGVRNTKKFGI